MNEGGGTVVEYLAVPGKESIEGVTGLVVKQSIDQRGRLNPYINEILKAVRPILSFDAVTLLQS